MQDNSFRYNISVSSNLLTLDLRYSNLFMERKIAMKKLIFIGTAALFLASSFAFAAQHPSVNASEEQSKEMRLAYHDDHHCHKCDHEHNHHHGHGHHHQHHYKSKTGKAGTMTKGPQGTQGMPQGMQGTQPTQ
jgi:ABC-type nickel/cobalt efflux system permease component RcnA